MQNVTALAVLLFFRVPALGLGSLSLLSDAVQRRDLESWLGRYGLVGESVVTGLAHKTTLVRWVGWWMGAMGRV